LTRKTRIAIIAIAIILMVAATYWAYLQLQPPRVEKVRLGYLHADVHQIAFFIAKAKDLFSKHGLVVEPKEYTYGMPEMMDFMAGELDAGWVGCVPAIIAKSQGADIVVLASANLEGSAIVAKEGVNSLEDLNGLKVGHPGVGSIQYCMLMMLKERYGLNFTLVEFRVSELPLALERGDVDAFIAWEPFCSEAVVRGFGHVICSSHDILPNHQCCVFYVSGKLFRERPDVAKSLLKVHVEAMKLANEDPAYAMSTFCELTGKDLEVVEECWPRMVYDYHVNVTSLEIFASFLAKQGIIDLEPSEVPSFISSLVDQTLLAEVEG